jgi:hypothetical protein
VRHQTVVAPVGASGDGVFDAVHPPLDLRANERLPRLPPLGEAAAAASMSAALTRAD